jgi:hypothetical protein
MIEAARVRWWVVKVGKSTSVVAGAVVLLLAALEIGSYLLLTMPGRILWRFRAKPPQYEGQAWATTYWREEVASQRNAYQAYVGWRRVPYQGSTIVVDAQGLRRTLHTRCDGSTPLIYMFGVRRPASPQRRPAIRRAWSTCT